jgi:hypothetical protein
MRRSFSPKFHKLSPFLLTLWLFCWMVGGVAHLACHLDDDAKMPPPAAPHPCLICQSLAQSGRSDIFTLTRASLQPVFLTFYLSRQPESRPAAHASALALAPNRGPPSYLRI